MSYIDTKAKRERIQQALRDARYDIGPDGVDGDIGDDTKRAILKFRAEHGLGNKPGIVDVDTDLMRELGLLTIQDPIVVGAAAAKGIDLLSLIKAIGLIQTLLKGTKMDSTKPWYASQTIIANIVALAALGLTFFHVGFSAADQATLVNGVIEAIGGVSVVWGIIARLTATKKIG